MDDDDDEPEETCLLCGNPISQCDCGYGEEPDEDDE